LVIAYLFFHLSILINQFWYAELFTIFGWLSIISITALVIADALILLIKATDDISGKLRFIPFITLPSSYITLRVLFFYFPSDLTIVASLSIMILLTIFITFLLLKYKTKKFNTKTGMKPLRGKDDEEKKGKRRISRKRNN